MNDWIKCSDRLPFNGQTVLVSGGTAQLKNGVWYTGMEEPLFRRPIEWTVTHWMPLPMAPNDETKTTER